MFTQLVFEHALRIRMKAETFSDLPSASDTSAATPRPTAAGAPLSDARQDNETARDADGNAHAEPQDQGCSVQWELAPQTANPKPDGDTT